MVSKGQRCKVKIDPGLETSCHDNRVSLIDRKLATTLVQCGATMTTSKTPYSISTSHGGSKTTRSDELLLIEIEFDKVKGTRCQLKCVVTDLLNYDIIISYRDYAFLNLQHWLIDGKHTQLELGDSEELDAINTQQRSFIF